MQQTGDWIILDIDGKSWWSHNAFRINGHLGGQLPMGSPHKGTVMWHRGVSLNEILHKQSSRVCVCVCVCVGGGGGGGVESRVTF